VFDEDFKTSRKKHANAQEEYKPRPAYGEQILTRGKRKAL
jgi:hypothetical protein